MALYRILPVVFVLFLSFGFGEAFFRLKARFPNQRTNDHERATKKTVCPYCRYETKYFKQKLDHFNFERKTTFQQRYLVNKKNWKSGGPIFFYTGNEGDITWFANNTGFMWDNAEEFGAMLVFGEHRYYGESLPFGEKSYESPKYLGYLTSEQALADFATLIRHIKDTFPGAQNSPVIAIGGSYGGMLAAWIRMKYPNVVTGSLAASAPILQFQGLTPCEDFYQIVTKDFNRDGGKPCVDSIRRSWNIIKKMKISVSGRRILSKVFRLCSPLTSEDKVTVLEEWLSETWVNLAMGRKHFMLDILFRTAYFDAVYTHWKLGVSFTEGKRSTRPREKSSKHMRDPRNNSTQTTPRAQKGSNSGHLTERRALLPRATPYPRCFKRATVPRQAQRIEFLDRNV